MMRIAIAGFQHETNTFTDTKADFNAFSMSKDWPALCAGDDMLGALEGYHLPVTGAINRLSAEKDVEIIPLCWAFAVPCGPVTRDAFERISKLMLDLLKSAEPVDAVYLDLHGAMVSEHYDDAEGELLRRLRMLIGSHIPIAASLDYHANITEQMVDFADYLDVYRRYPHTDMGETGERAAAVLLDMLRKEYRFHKEFCKGDYLIPLNLGSTTLEPCKSLLGCDLQRIRHGLEPNGHISFAAGFALADIEEAGPSVIAYSLNASDAGKALDDFKVSLQQVENDFSDIGVDAEVAVREALSLSRTVKGPVIIADTQDNPGAGGYGDTTGLLRALVSQNAAGAIFGFISDEQTSQRAHALGIGREFEGEVGGKMFRSDCPLCGRFTVLALGDGEFLGTGPMWRGARMQLGPCALLEHKGIKIAVSSKTVQTGDASMFRHLGIEPREESIIALKSSVHFRADFERFAGAIVVALAPGPVPADPRGLKYQKLRSAVRVGPGLLLHHIKT